MWFEILPSFGLVVVFMTAPHAIAGVLNKVTVDNFFRRRLCTQEQTLQYLRDRRLTGDPYKVQGLEAIPDE